MKRRKRAWVEASDFQLWLDEEVYAPQARVLVLPPEYLAMCQGDALAALLLAELAYWTRPMRNPGDPTRGDARFSKLQVERDGCWWRVATYAELADRLGCSPDQVKRALAKLDRLGLIERRSWFAGKVKRLHLRLAEDSFTVAFKEALNARPRGD